MRTSAAHTVVMAAVVIALVAPLKATAQNRAPRTNVSRAADVPPGLAAIREADLRRDMEALAGDAMRGRGGVACSARGIMRHTRWCPSRRSSPW